MPELFDLISRGYRFGSICGRIMAGCFAPWTITLMEFPVLFVFCTDMIGNAPYASLTNDVDVKAVIFKDRCLNWIESGTMCMTCYDRCPLRGEGMVLDMGYVPAVGESCVGCGMCEYVCPKNAVAVVPDVQKKGGKA